MARIPIALTLVLLIAGPVFADYTLPPVDFTVNLASVVPLDSSGVPADTYIGAVVTVDWVPLDGGARSDRAMWNLRRKSMDPDDPNNLYADPGMAVDSASNADPVTLHYFAHFTQPYYGDGPLEIAAKQIYGSGAEWQNVTITLITTSPVPEAMEYLSLGTITAGDRIAGDNTGAITSLYGKNEVRRDGTHDYQGSRYYMGWEDAGDDVYTLDWPGGDLQVDLISPPGSGDLDLFLWGDQTACLAWSYGQDPNEQIRVPGLAAGTYWVHVDGWQGAEHSYTLDVTQGYHAPYVYTNHQNTFNNFGPGDTYREQETNVTGLLITYRQTAPDGWDQGPRFIPSVSGYVTEVVAATHMSAWNDDNIVELWICENDASDPTYPIGKPGAILEKVVCKEEMDIAAFPETTTPIHFTASGETYLEAGVVYWLVASSPGPHHSDVTWARNNQWPSGTPGSIGDYAAREGSDESWMIRTNYPFKLPACRIVVADRAVSPPPGDIDGDMDVYVDDVVAFGDCLSGPENVVPPVGVDPLAFDRADLDGDGDVDLDDFADFQIFWSAAQ